LGVRDRNSPCGRRHGDRLAHEPPLKQPRLEICWADLSHPTTLEQLHVSAGAPPLSVSHPVNYSANRRAQPARPSSRRRHAGDPSTFDDCGRQARRASGGLCSSKAVTLRGQRLNVGFPKRQLGRSAFVAKVHNRLPS
jgi:hypothetical protein